MNQGYAPIVLKKEDRRKYYQVLQMADGGDMSPFANFITKAAHESLMYYLSIFVNDERLLSLKDIAEFAPYSQEYLSLRARQGKLDAVKIENVWFSTKRALKEYLESFR
jgi:hypothetical protein